MSQAFKCDRCGVFCDGGNIPWLEQFQIQHKDLCEPCKDSLKEWWAAGGGMVNPPLEAHPISWPGRCNCKNGQSQTTAGCPVHGVTL